MRRTIAVLAVLAMATTAMAGSTSTYFTGNDLSELPDPLATDDLIAGMIGDVEAGGFLGATPDADASDLTDGIPGMAVEAVLLDFSWPALQIRYDFAEATDVFEIRVFAENFNSGNPNSRPGQTYQVEYSLVGDDTFTRLPIASSQSPTEDLVQTGTFDGDGFGADFLFATETVVYDDGGGLLMEDIDSLRFVFYNVGNTAAAYYDPYDAGDPRDMDGFPAAFEASIIKEIDVIIPEPASIGLLLLGGLAVLRRR
jgi:hypothetical protein